MTKKTIFWAMLVMVLAFGMTVVGCDIDPTDDDTDDNKEKAINLPSTSGEFTFTGIPAKYNGKFALLEGYFSNNSSRLMLGFKSGTINTSNPNYYSTLTGVKIENGSVKLPVYTFFQSSPASTMQAYTGSDSVRINILVYNAETNSAATLLNYNAAAIFGTQTTFPVQFSNGKVSKTNDEATSKLE